MFRLPSGIAPTEPAVAAHRGQHRLRRPGLPRAIAERSGCRGEDAALPALSPHQAGRASSESATCIRRSCGLVGTSLYSLSRASIAANSCAGGAPRPRPAFARRWARSPRGHHRAGGHRGSLIDASIFTDLLISTKRRPCARGPRCTTRRCRATNRSSITRQPGAGGLRAAAKNHGGIVWERHGQKPLLGGYSHN